MLSWGLPKYIKTKLQTSCFCITLGFLFFIKKEFWEWFPCLIFCMIFQEKDCSCYILLTDQISLFDCLYFAKHLTICVLQFFVNQVVTSYILKIYISNSVVLSTWPKSQEKSLNTLRMKGSFKVKKSFFFLWRKQNKVRVWL